MYLAMTLSNSDVSLLVNYKQTFQVPNGFKYWYNHYLCSVTYDRDKFGLLDTLSILLLLEFLTYRGAVQVTVAK